MSGPGWGWRRCSTAKSTYDAATLALLEGGSGADDYEEMFERGWSDGLPVIPPTPERVETMLAGRDADRRLGTAAPAKGEVTLQQLAACAVLAGCRPETLGSDPRFA